MKFLKEHRVWLTTAAVGLISFLTPSVTHFIASHPQYGVAGATLWGVATAWAKSPNQ